MVLVLEPPPHKERKPPPPGTSPDIKETTEEHNKIPTLSPRYTKFEEFLWKYSLSFVAASCAEVVTYPLDLTKTRLQIQGELASERLLKGVPPEKKKGMSRIAFGIVRKEGATKLWQGLTPAILRHVVYSGVRMTFYESLREDVLGKNMDGTIPLWKSIVAGVSAGSLAQFLSSPADLVKIQIQMEGRRRVLGQPPRVKGTWHAFSTILKQGGVRGLWAGCIPNVQRAAFVNMGDLTTYDTAKHLILVHTRLEDNYFTHILSSFCSGLMGSLLGTPADVIKTRMMNQPTDANGRGLIYRGSVDCLVQAVKGEGFLALYKGFIPCWLRLAPWSLTFWLSYEKLRNVTGVSSF